MRLVLTTLICILTSFVLLKPCLAQQTRLRRLHLTLADAIYLALRNNPQVQSAKLDRTISKFSVLVARNAFDLQLAIKGSVGYTRTKTNGEKTDTQNYVGSPQVNLKTPYGTEISSDLENETNGANFSPSVSFSINQPLLRGLNPAVNLAPLHNAIDQNYINKLQLKQTVISTISQVTQDYYSLFAAKRNLKITEAALVRAHANAENTKQLIAAGRRPRMDLIQAQQNISQNELNLIQQKNQIRESQQNLLLAIGIDPQTPFSIAKKITIPNYKLPSLQNSIAIALRNSPTYQGALIQLKVDHRNLLVARDNAKWQLDAGVKSTFGSVSGVPVENSFAGITDGQNNSQSVNLTLNIPINNLQLKQAIIAAQIAIKQQQLQVAFDKRRITTQVINAVSEIKLAKRAIKTAIANNRYAHINLKDAYEKLQFGRISMFIVTQQQNSFTSSEQALLNAKIQYLNAINAYEQLLQTALKRWNITIRY